MIGSRPVTGPCSTAWRSWDCTASDRNIRTAGKPIPGRASWHETAGMCPTFITAGSRRKLQHASWTTSSLRGNSPTRLRCAHSTPPRNGDRATTAGSRSTLWKGHEHARAQRRNGNRDVMETTAQGSPQPRMASRATSQLGGGTWQVKVSGHRFRFSTRAGSLRIRRRPSPRTAAGCSSPKTARTG